MVNRAVVLYFVKHVVIHTCAATAQHTDAYWARSVRFIRQWEAWGLRVRRSHEICIAVLHAVFHAISLLCTSIHSTYASFSRHCLPLHVTLRLLDCCATWNVSARYWLPHSIPVSLENNGRLLATQSYTQWVRIKGTEGLNSLLVTTRWSRQTSWRRHRRNFFLFLMNA